MCVYKQMHRPAHARHTIRKSYHTHAIRDTMRTLTLSRYSFLDLEVAEFYEVGVFGVSDCDAGVDFLDEFLLLVVVEVHVPLG